jgi:hypothetical protein
MTKIRHQTGKVCRLPQEKPPQHGQIEDQDKWERQICAIPACRERNGTRRCRSTIKDLIHATDNKSLGETYCFTIFAKKFTTDTPEMTAVGTCSKRGIRSSAWWSFN